MVDSWNNSSSEEMENVPTVQNLTLKNHVFFKAICCMLLVYKGYTASNCCACQTLSALVLINLSLYIASWSYFQYGYAYCTWDNVEDNRKGESQVIQRVYHHQIRSPYGVYTWWPPVQGFVLRTTHLSFRTTSSTRSNLTTFPVTDMDFYKATIVSLSLLTNSNCDGGIIFQQRTYPNGQYVYLRDR